MQYALIIFVALFLDGLAAALSFSIASAAFGVGGVLQLIPFLGQILGAGTWATGVALGFVVNMTLNLTLGAGFLFMLALNGMFYWRIVAWGGGEIIPVLNNLPFWTLLAVRSSMEHAKRTKQELSVQKIQTVIGTRADSINAAGERATQRMNEIRPRSNNAYATAT